MIIPSSFHQPEERPVPNPQSLLIRLMGDYVDDLLLATLVNMGFDHHQAKKALAVTGNVSADDAIGKSQRNLKLDSIQKPSLLFFSHFGHLPPPPKELILSGALELEDQTNTKVSPLKQAHDAIGNTSSINSNSPAAQKPSSAPEKKRKNNLCEEEEEEYEEEEEEDEEEEEEEEEYDMMDGDSEGDDFYNDDLEFTGDTFHSFVPSTLRSILINIAFGTAEGASLGIPDKEANAIKCYDEKQIGKLQISYLATIVVMM